MQMTGQRVLPVPPRQAWDALNDPEMLKDCIPGCESVVRTEPLRYELVMAARIGPVSAKFKGRLTQSDVVEPSSYRIAFDGQGGAAGFGKGSADVRLSPVDAGTQLDYDVNAQIGGKLAQIGSRLVDSAARKIADDFFANFEQRLRDRMAAAGPTPVVDAAGEPAAAGADGTTGSVPAAATAVPTGPTPTAPGAATTAAPIAATVASPPGPATDAAGGTPRSAGDAPGTAGTARRIGWAIAAAVVLGVVLWLLR